MTSAPVAPSALVGVQQPRVWSVPRYRASSGGEAVELARMAGLNLDPWQEFVLHHSLGEREDGKWAAREVGLEVPRQNGKGSILEARELAGLFILGERLLIHSAHQFDTSLEAFRRLLFLIENTPDLDQLVKRVSKSHGEEGIELKSGQRIRFRTRTSGGGRGFTGDWLGLDEAMYLSEAAHGALMPTLSARPNPQIWYTGSAVDREVHDHGLVFTRVRKRGHAGDPMLAWFEWSADGELENALDLAESEEAWAQANPGLGIRISAEHVGLEQRSMDPRTFAVERLGIGDWPSLDTTDGQVISAAAWKALEDPDSVPLDPVCFAFDVKPDRSKAAIGVAGFREDGQVHVGVIEHKTGTGWVPDRLLELVQKHSSVGVILDQAGPAAALLAPLEGLGVQVRTVTAREYTQACGLLYDKVEQETVRHRGTPELLAAIRGAGRRPLVDAWAWSRKASTADISPLVAITLALWGSVDAGPPGGGFEW